MNTNNNLNYESKNITNTETEVTAAKIFNTQIDTIENLGTEANDISDTLDVKLDTNAVTASAKVFADFFHDSWDIMVDASMNLNPGDLAKVLVSAAESVSNGMDEKHDLDFKAIANASDNTNKSFEELMKQFDTMASQQTSLDKRGINLSDGFEAIAADLKNENIIDKSPALV